MIHREQPNRIRRALDRVHLVGLSFRTADLALRGKVSFYDARLIDLLERLKQAGAAEAMVLSTCNRTEIYFVGTSKDELLEALSVSIGEPIDAIYKHLYHRQGASTAQHLFKVCSGMDSAVLGENEIQAQVKESWRASKIAGTMGPLLDLLYRHALTASKRVRTETDLTRGVTSFGSLAVREAARMGGGLKGKKVLLLGAGRIAERVAKELATENPASVCVMSRTLHSAEQLGCRYGLNYADFDRLDESLAEADIVFTAVSSKRAVLTEERLARAAEARGSRTLVVVDLGVPPNVAYEAKKWPCYRLVNVDHLIQQCDRNAEVRETALPLAKTILEEEMTDLREAFARRDAAPSIQLLVQKGERVRERNLTWALDKLGELDPKTRKLVEDLSLRIVKGLLEGPIEALKENSPDSVEHELIDRLFGLASDGGEPDLS